MVNTSPFTDTQYANCVAAALTGVPETIIAMARKAGTITGISLTFSSAITASDSVYRTFTAYNRGTAGTGTTVVATLVTNVAQGNIANGDEEAMTLSATAADLVVAEGDVLEIVETVASTGTAHSGWRSTTKIRPDC